MLNALPADEWTVAGFGSVPGVMGALRFDSYVIMIGNDESATGRINKDDLKKVGDSKYCTDKFLKLVKLPIPVDK